MIASCFPIQHCWNLETILTLILEFFRFLATWNLKSCPWHPWSKTHFQRKMLRHSLSLHFDLVGLKWLHRWVSIFEKMLGSKSTVDGWWLNIFTFNDAEQVLDNRNTLRLVSWRMEILALGWVITCKITALSFLWKTLDGTCGYLQLIRCELCP